MKKLLVSLICLAMVLPVFGQSRVSGTVRDANGDPVPGAAVFVNGTTTATSTGLDGKYSILAKESDVLTFSCIGFEDASVPVGTRHPIGQGSYGLFFWGSSSVPAFQKTSLVLIQE